MLCLAVSSICNKYTFANQRGENGISFLLRFPKWLKEIKNIPRGIRALSAHGILFNCASLPCSFNMCFNIFLCLSERHYVHHVQEALEKSIKPFPPPPLHFHSIREQGFLVIVQYCYFHCNHAYPSNPNTTLQSIMYAKIRQQRFRHCHENGFINMI